MTALAVDMGWVNTNIQPWMQGVVNPGVLGWMRKADLGVLPVLHALALPDEALRGRIRDEGLVVDVFNRVKPAFSEVWWRHAGHTATSGAQ
eukprot:CAMPEP_0118983466 /NCGR_PEP_ID=MMETSP1173-20130426/35452_1 /TAXON_ID=1034831 /ORGANISM="Rhizochromulina marina cf, Strain CCMP1243" /LENGTH=90 /DNA_ID=CAMNT_0006934043 /DNA_START=3 /DNA_END=272 /DNA_ORIENTATION=-